jgi:hypothetical protein
MPSPARASRQRPVRCIPPALHPHSALITGVVCGVRVEEIDDPLMQKIRYLDKLIDELAKGKSMDKILRQ